MTAEAPTTAPVDVSVTATELVIDKDILVVDDEPSIRDMIALFLRRLGFVVDCAKDGKDALEQFAAKRYFLVITDVGMPGISGMDLLSEIKALATDGDPAPTDVIIVTGKSAEAVAVEALRRGAYDYFRKPFSFDAMRFTVQRLLERRRLRRQAHQVHTLQVRIDAEKSHAQQAVAALVEAVYAKDSYTRGHMERVGRIAAVLGKHMGRGDEEVEILYRAGTLHDIGKIGTPDLVLNKPASLTESEWETIRLHPVVGANILAPIRALEPVCSPVRCHHERWDGSGYPSKMAGKDIPESARILAVADVCDALHSDRAYRAGLPVETVRAIIHEGRGKLFDPEVCDCFQDLCDKQLIFEPMVGSAAERRVGDAEVAHPC
ncbi:MAG: putative cyclic di-GMP phosphodiesterase [Planctomycetes bacterium]|nr:putative cyclic di-GMP phosphodiesterase [Planctomycetota bacterium]